MKDPVPAGKTLPPHRRDIRGPRRPTGCRSMAFAAAAGPAQTAEELTIALERKEDHR